MKAKLLVCRLSVEEIADHVSEGLESRTQERVYLSNVPRQSRICILKTALWSLQLDRGAGDLNSVHQT